jgi:phosphonate transport system ATP-binding protein
MGSGRRPMIEAQDLRVTYPSPRGRPAVAALDGLSFAVQEGEFVAVIGPSGAGKTTLLRSLTGFVRPSAGRLVVSGCDVAQARTAQLRRLRREVATISQQFDLVERASALDNVLIGRLGQIATLPSLFGWFPTCDRRLAWAALAELGLAPRALERADRLSGGERQRVAIARALVQRPRLVLADEPAASLDVALTRLVLDILRRLNREHGVSVVVNLHDLDLARSYAARVLALRDGRLVLDGTIHRLTGALQQEIYHGGALDAERSTSAGRLAEAAD